MAKWNTKGMTKLAEEIFKNIEDSDLCGGEVYAVIDLIKQEMINSYIKNKGGKKWQEHIKQA